MNSKSATLLCLSGIVSSCLASFVLAADQASTHNNDMPKKRGVSDAVEMTGMAPAMAPGAETDLLKDGLKNWYFDRKGVDIGSVAKVEDGILKLSGAPTGSLISRQAYKDYEIEVEWRWPGKPGNGGVLPHVSTPNQIGVWPRSMECQILNGHAAEFLAIPRALPFDAKPGPKKGGVAKKPRRRLSGNGITCGFNVVVIASKFGLMAFLPTNAAVGQMSPGQWLYKMKVRLMNSVKSSFGPSQLCLQVVKLSWKPC
jgi:hypothetical protein